VRLRDRLYSAVVPPSLIRSACDTYWQDSAANLVWMRPCGGMAMVDEADLKPNSDRALYRETFVRVYGR
jgi:hypothetical protein